MMTSLFKAVQSLCRQARSTPRRRAVTRYALSVGTVAAIFGIIPHTPVDGPVGGVFALGGVVVCCWFGGLGPALLMPLTVWFVSRVTQIGDSPDWIPSTRELMTFIGLTMLTGSVGLAGQFQRRLRTTTLRHDAQMREQAQALSAARIVFRDLDGRVTNWSSGIEELYGWSSSEATGRSLPELLRTEYPVPVDEIRTTLLRDGQWQGEVTQHRKDGAPLQVITHCILYRADEQSAGVAEVHSNVTDLRRAEAAIRDADRRKDLFVATLAHELRNPLAPLRTGLEVLQMTRSDSEDDRDTLEIMQRQMEHVVRMVDDLLDVGRINTGKIQLRRQPVPLADLVRDAVESCRPHIDSQRHTLHVSLPDEPLLLHADSARLVQVLMNLLSNASKFTDPGGQIRLTAERLQDHVEIRVSDSGAGIAAAALPGIFDMFAQVDDPRNHCRGGLGLGLSIVRTLVELHGGTVHAHSDGLGQGSTFIVRLPVSTGHHTQPVAAPHDNAARNGSPHSGRVLVVDDNRDAARTLSLMLSKLGYECHSAEDGHSALKLADELRPHAILLDLGMPGMSGLEVARRLRAHDHHQAVTLIAVTGWDKDEDRRQSRAAGFDHHLAKPVEINRLRELLNVTSTNGSPKPASTIA